MTTAGGGWTAVFAGRNGGDNAFDRFDEGSYHGICTDPATRCLRRAPATLVSGSLGVSCGGTFVAFGLTAAARSWLVSGTQAGWVGLTPTAVVGAVPSVPNGVFTGQSSNVSFTFATNATQGSSTYASQSGWSSGWWSCNGQPDVTSPVRIYYRE